MKKVVLLQPRHVYAPSFDQGLGHVYSPTSLWTVGAKLLQAGVDITFADENIRPSSTEHADVIGVNFVGPPYIPVVRERLKSIIDRGEQQIVLGGQVISGLTRAQLSTLFGERAVNGMSILALEQATGAVLTKMSEQGSISQVLDETGAALEEILPDEQVSLIPSYMLISDDDMRQYLHPQREISFYLSQGCLFRCTFCPAKKGMKERYREMGIIEQDLTYLTERAQKLGIQQLSMYLSNLDIFQTAERLVDFAAVIQRLQRKYHGFTYRLRGLATVTSFVNIAKKNGQIIQAMKDAGLHTVGFGIDGGDTSVWRSVKKGHNQYHTIVRAMQLCCEYGITPENIMVFGHPNETRESLENAVRLTGDLQEYYGAVPRPHVAKDLVPGNDYWRNDNMSEAPQIREERRNRIKIFLECNEYFQALDFKALATSLSHPDVLMRYMVNEYYRTITNMSGNPRELIYPIAPEFSPEINALHREWNLERYDR